MMVSPRDTGDRDAPPDNGASAHAHGSFFGRRKGHKLRIHQADLIDNLLPHLALDIGTSAPDDLTELFESKPDAVRLEIGFGGGEHLVAEALAFPDIGFIGFAAAPRPSKSSLRVSTWTMPTAGSIFAKLQIGSAPAAFRYIRFTLPYMPIMKWGEPELRQSTWLPPIALSALRPWMKSSERLKSRSKFLSVFWCSI